MWMNDRIHYASGREALRKFSAQQPGETEDFPRDEDHEAPERALSPWEIFFRKLLKRGEAG